MKPADIDDCISRVKAAFYFPSEDSAQLEIEDLDKIIAEIYVLRWRLNQVANILNESHNALKMFI